MTDTNTLAPCPFCGGVPHLKPSTRGDYTSIVCPIESVCGGPIAVVIPNDQIEEGIAAWNRRTPATASQPVAAPASGWLRDGSMVYRLTDQRIPSNRDEISVTMVDGSRDWDRRGEQAERIRQMLSVNVAAPAGMPELGSIVGNDAAWKFVEAMPHRIPGPIWNDLKPALYAALLHFHGQMANLAAAPSGPAREPLTPEQLYEVMQTACPQLLDLANQWSNNKIHSYQFASQAEIIVNAVVRRAEAAHGITAARLRMEGNP